MYDKIKLMLYDLPIGYNWQTVLQRTVDYFANGTGGKDWQTVLQRTVDYFANGTGGKGYWLGRRVIVIDTYVSFEGMSMKT